MDISDILAEYEQRRRLNRDELNERCQAVFARVPDIKAGRDEMRSIAMTMARHAIDGGLAAIEYGKFAQTRMLELRTREKELLLDNGYDENELEMRYRCEICKDSGYVGEVRRTQCECLKHRIAWAAYSRYGATPREEECFENFDIALFPNTSMGRNMLSQREGMQLLKERAMKYVEEYPNNAKINMLLIGGTGMGKTFLLNCIANAFLKRDISFLKLTAFTLFEELREDHVGRGEKHALRDFLDVPVLIIDDLGTEPLINNVTVEYFFSILNERAANRRQTLISTNMMPGELMERYGERIASRLHDTSNTQCTVLRGKDIRLIMAGRDSQD